MKERKSNIRRMKQCDSLPYIRKVVVNGSMLGVEMFCIEIFKFQLYIIFLIVLFRDWEKKTEPNYYVARG